MQRLAVLLGVCLLVVGCGATAPAPTATPALPKEVHAPLKVGSSATISLPSGEAHTVTIGAIESNQALTAINLIILNAGTTEIRPGSLRLRFSDNTETDQPSRYGTRQYPESSALSPGGKTSWIPVYEVPDGTKIVWIRYAPLTGNGAAIYFDAQ